MRKRTLFLGLLGLFVLIALALSIKSGKKRSHSVKEQSDSLRIKAHLDSIYKEADADTLDFSDVAN